MKLVQIAASKEGGAYYFCPSCKRFYHVPHEDLMELNNVQPRSILLWLVFFISVGFGIMKLPKDMFSGSNFTLLVRGLLVISMVSSLGLCHIIKKNQIRIRGLILKNYEPADIDKELLCELKKGRKGYWKLTFYVIFLFFMSALSIIMLYEDSDAVLAIFFVVFLDSAIMLLSILQPIKKLHCFWKIKREISFDNKSAL